MTTPYWATEYLKLAFVGDPVSYGQAMLTGAGIGAAYGGLSGGLAGLPAGISTNPYTGEREYNTDTAKTVAGVTATVGGLAGAGLGAWYAKRQRNMANATRAYEAQDPELRDKLYRISDAKSRGVPITPEAEALLKLHGYSYG